MSTHSYSTLRLVHVLPIVFTSNVLMFGAESFAHIIPYTKLPTNVLPDGPVLSHLFTGFFYRGIAILFPNIALATGSAAYAWAIAEPGLAKSLYGWTSLLAAAHLAFGPSIAGYCKDAFDVKKDARETQRAVAGWLGVHRWRIIVDALAVTCAIGAFVHDTE